MIIPCINAVHENEAKEQLEKIVPLGAELIHWDLTDGVFTPHHSWGLPAAVKNLTIRYSPSAIRLELHLMLDHPETVLDEWLAAKLVRRVIIHADSAADLDTIRAKCLKEGVELMLAIAPETSVEALHERRLDESMQVLAVHPGPSGQEFNPAMLERVRILRAYAPNATIEIDGGITPETLKLYKKAGATDFVSGAYITKASDSKKAYRELLDALEE